MLLWSVEVCYAQDFIKDTIVSKEIIVYGDREEEFDAGVKATDIDSTTKVHYKYANLSTLLEQNSTIYIKSYGLGSLSSMSFRGASASQTSVLWNGFVLQSPMNGLLDLALVPVSFVDNVKVQFGGCGAMWGSGSVSGSIHLDNKLSYGKGLSVGYNMGFGSFGSVSPSASVAWSTKKMITSVRGFFAKAENDFPFRNTAQYGEPYVKQSNAQMKQYGYLWDNYVKLNKRNQLVLRVWQQYSDRNIPPTMVSSSSDALQEDWFLRVSSEWQHSGAFSAWNVRIAYFDENLHYQQASAFIDSHNRSVCLISEAETKLAVFKNALWNIGFNNTYSEAYVDSYTGVPHQNRSAVFSSFKYSGKENKYRLNAGVRKEIISGSRYTEILGVPLMPYGGIDFRITSKFSLKSNVSRNFRLPTFNDLYWTPGGNINLKPEQGWSEELGLQFSHQNQECTGENCKPETTGLAEINFSSTIFNRNIDNWIMWVPEGAYWLPKNVLKVWSRGLENSVNTVWKLRTWKINIGVQYDYILSTNEKVPEGNQSELHKQLIYVPLHKASLSSGIGYNGYRLSYAHQYTGWVYTQADNEAFLAPFWLGNIIFSKKYSLKRNNIDLLFRVNNIWNKNYQVIAYRAMPGRNFEIGISAQFNTK